MPFRIAPAAIAQLSGSIAPSLPTATMLLALFGDAGNTPMIIEILKSSAANQVLAYAQAIQRSD